MTEEERTKLLNKLYWSLADIQEFVGCGKTKASRIRQEAIIKHGGYNKLLPQKVKRDSVLKALNVNI